MSALALVAAVSDALAGEHLVRQGETWDSIARAWGTDIPALQAAAGTTTLPAPGTTLRTPDRAGQIDVPAILASVVGTVSATDPTGAPMAIRPGTRLAVGSTLCTRPGSYATLRLAASEAGHDDLNLSESSCVRVQTSARAGSTRQSRVTLQSGSLSVRSADTAPSTVVVDTASGVAAGSGGFRVHVEEGGKTRLESTATTVAMLGGGVEQTVDRGYGTRASAGKAPEAPTKLPDPGMPNFPDDGAALRDALFGWTEIPRALGYRVEIASTPDFADVVTSEDVPTTAWTPEVLLLPTQAEGLWWRVASFDRTGFLGMWSPPRAIALPR